MCANRCCHLVQFNIPPALVLVFTTGRYSPAGECPPFQCQACFQSWSCTCQGILWSSLTSWFTPFLALASWNSQTRYPPSRLATGAGPINPHPTSVLEFLWDVNLLQCLGFNFLLICITQHPPPYLPTLWNMVDFSFFRVSCFVKLVKIHSHHTCR